MKDFKPTALLVKTHTKTGLKYLCKTTQIHKMHSYKGSGLHWRRHLKKHGASYTTEFLGIWYDPDKISEYALRYSSEHNIVKSKDWANLKPENGLDGGFYDKRKRITLKNARTEKELMKVIRRFL